MSRTRHTLGHIVGYHGCDAAVGEAVLAGKDKLKPSVENYDWLGNGIYFWADSPERAWDWALAGRAAGKIKTPFVVGALVYPGLCLNLTDYGVIEELRAAYKVVETLHGGHEMPRNTRPKSGVPLLRRLDCAVIETLHQLRADDGLDSYDTVFGVFDEGDEAYPSAGFREKTHIQLAVRNPDVIVGLFRVDAATFPAP
ncbi:MAG: hypothetical protein ISP90_00405 [Nevskia sp.]|nr:hypothetical protein [Nevskia sp.]